MGERLRGADWSASPLGPPALWPVSLRSVVQMMLVSRQPMFMTWGPEMTVLYNDDYLPFLGARHPEALGRPFPQIWSDVWPDLRPLVEQALSGTATWSDDLHLVMTRNGYAEDTWWSFSYSPLHDETGAIAGMLDICSDSTPRVLSERRAATLVELSDLTSHARDPQDVLGRAAALLGRRLDVPRVSYGEVDAQGRRVVAAHDWSADPDVNFTGVESDLAHFGDETPAALRRGETVRIDDVARDPRSAPFAAAYARLGIGAILAVPLIRNGRLTATLSLHEADARRWTDHDVP